MDGPHPVKSAMRLVAPLLRKETSERALADCDEHIPSDILHNRQCWQHCKPNVGNIVHYWANPMLATLYTIGQTQCWQHCTPLGRHCGITVHNV
eukprot:g59970.t1